MKTKAFTSEFDPREESRRIPGHPRVPSPGSPNSVPAEKEEPRTSAPTEIRFVGLRRSGSHAVQNWLLSHFDEPICYLNDISKKRLHPDQPSDRLPVLQRRATASLADPRAVTLYSYEDKRLLWLENHPFPYSASGSDAAKPVTILLLRDPFNLFASRLKIMRDRPRNACFRDMLLVRGDGRAFLPRLWINYAKEFLGHTGHLGGRTLCVNYNTWLTSENYRESLRIELGLPDAGWDLERVPRFGFGSSFDGTRYNGRASQMDLLGRWRHFEEDETFRQLVHDEELRSLSATIFGEIAESTDANDPGGPA